MSAASKEVAPYSPQLATEQVMSAYGTERDGNQGVVRDADYDTLDLDQESLNVRLIERRVGEQTLYTLRVDSPDQQRSIYTYKPAVDSLTQRVRHDGVTTEGSLDLPTEAIQSLLPTADPRT